MKSILCTSALLLAAACGSENEVVSEKAGLSVAYVSGHLGDESACPLLEPQSLLADACALPCEPDPCANGMIMVRVENIAEHAVPIQIRAIELVEGKKATALTILEVATIDGKTLQQLEPGQSATVRILFPEQGHFGEREKGNVRVTVSGENDERLKVTSPALQKVPVVVT